MGKYTSEIWFQQRLPCIIPTIMGVLMVKKSRVGMGFGLFVTTDFKEGDFIIEYTGEIISSKEADRRVSKYLFQIDEYYTIDGAGESNRARYINHFCNPNIEAVVEAGQINFYALRDIQEGEELGFDYGEEYKDEFITPFGCKCPHCA